MLYHFNSGGLEEPDIVSQIVTDKTDFIDFENSKYNLPCDCNSDDDSLLMKYCDIVCRGSMNCYIKDYSMLQTWRQSHLDFNMA